MWTEYWKGFDYGHKCVMENRWKDNIAMDLLNNAEKNSNYFVAPPIRDERIDDEGVAEDEFLMSSPLAALSLSNNRRTINQLTFAVDGYKDDKVIHRDWFI